MTLLVVWPISLLVTGTVALRGLWGAALRGLWRVAVLVVGGISLGAGRLGAGRLGAGRLGAGRLGAGRLGAGRRAVLRALWRVATTLGTLRSVAALSVMCVIATRGALRRAALRPVGRSGSRLATRLTLLVTRRWRQRDGSGEADARRQSCHSDTGGDRRGAGYAFHVHRLQFPFGLNVTAAARSDICVPEEPASRSRDVVRQWHATSSSNGLVTGWEFASTPTAVPVILYELPTLVASALP
jgi:hypothetical protein